MTETENRNASSTSHHPASSRLRGAAAADACGGEIVEVQGGHIVRSTGRKDRHSKVCTARGPRDRRVRLSAHTAIQFYDVQDRLGYDRPSKAVDWLIKKAKAAIDELAELPAWHPTAANPAPRNPDPEEEEGEKTQHCIKPDVGAESSKKPAEAEPSTSAYGFHQHGGSGHSPGFLPAPLDSDAIVETIKSFFPISSQPSSIHFQNYPPDLLSRSNPQYQDLQLSLQSFPDPILLHHHHQHPSPSTEQTLFSVSAPLTFDSASSTSTWSQYHQCLGRLPRAVAWSAAEASGGGGGGFVFGASPQHGAQLLAQNQLFPPRGPLQSSNSPPVRAWAADPSTMAEHPSLSHAAMAARFAAGSFSGFRIPAPIQGEEEQDVTGGKPASSTCRH